MSQFDEIVSLSLNIVVGAPYVLFLATYDYRWLYVGLYGIIPLQIHSIIKEISKNYNYEFLKRPKGAKNCDMFSRNGNQEGKPGFPSGHVTTSVTFFTAIAILFPEYKDISIIIGIIYSLLMARSRINKKCHTVLQTIAGGVLGVSAPVIIHNLMNNK